MAKKTKEKAEKAPETPVEVPETPVEAPEEVATAPEMLEKTSEMPEMILETPVEAPEEAPEPAKEAEKASEEGEMPAEGDLKAGLSSILCVKKGKRDVPTLIMYHSAYARADRYVIVDINNNLLEDAWRFYKANAPDKDPEVFLATVYEICRHEVPRMYRAVGTLKLD